MNHTVKLLSSSAMGKGGTETNTAELNICKHAIKSFLTSSTNFLGCGLEFLMKVILPTLKS